MSNFEPAFWTQLSNMLNVLFPEVKKQVHRVTQLNRENWLNLVNGGKLTPPYIVCDIGERKEADWGMSNTCWEYPMELYYIVKANDGATTAKVTSVSEKMVLLRDALVTINDPATIFQVVDLPVMNMSDTNPANLKLFDIQAGMYAGQLKAKLIVGETFGS